MAKRMLVVLVVACACAWGDPLPQAGASSPGTGEITKFQAFALVRSANTGQAEAFGRTHRYVPLEVLLRTRFFQGRSDIPTISPTDRTAAEVGNYRLLVVVSPGAQHYAVQLVPVSGCGPALFSNESGVIYPGTALGCPPAQFR